MPNSLLTAEIARAAAAARPFRAAGRLQSASGLLTAELSAAIGELCRIELDGGAVLAEVVGFQGGAAQLMPFHKCRGLRTGALVTCLGRPCRVPVGDALLGRVVDGLGQAIDGGPEVAAARRASPHSAPPPPLQRPRISRPLPTGQRAIDALTTIGVGQRVGIFSGAGVGKSTLLGEIAKGAEADCCVIALIGERGREVRPFIEDCLGEQGRSRSATVVATSDETPLMRIRAAETAVAIAEQFRRQGRQVLLMLDSLTRLATAQREIGLLLGEPPSMRGYTPSVFQLLASLLERLGSSATGAVTALLTVLLEADEMEDPVGDAVRAIVDGHLVLDRKLAEQGHFPAISVPASLSRVFPDIVDDRHQAAARKLRQAMAVYDAAADLIRVGAYQSGVSPEIDRAVAIRPQILQLLRQAPGERAGWDQTRQALLATAALWPY